MTRGRRPRWNAFAEAVPDVWTEAATVAGKDRVSLSAAARNALGWLDPPPEDGLLAELHPQGSAELMPWKQAGEGRVQAQLDRLAEMKEPERGMTALALMDGMMRVQVEGAGRITLPANLRSFLESDRQAVVRFVIVQDRLWIWNEEQWQINRPTRFGLIEGSVSGSH